MGKGSVATEVILAASGSRTAAPTLSPAEWTADASAAALMVVVDITVPGTGSINVFVEGYDSASAKWFPILDSGALTTAQTKVLIVHPHVASAANASAAHPLPRRFRVRVVANNANAMTYSVGAHVLSV